MNKVIEQISGYIHRRARNAELCLWRVLFEGAPSVTLADALLPFQNEDGGFGHALEADCWSPESTPCQTQHALSLMRMAGFDDRAHPAIQGALRFIKSGKHRMDYGWCFTVPGNDLYPHAPWWTYNEDENRKEYYGVTADLSAFLLTHEPSDSEHRAMALGFAHDLLDNIGSYGRLGDMGLEGFIRLTDALETLGAPGFDYPALRAELARRVRESIGTDAGAWAHYGTRPSNLIHSPDSPYYAQNCDMVSKELDFLLDTLPEHDVWGIPWTWFDNMERYAACFAVSENWWRAQKAIEHALFLRAFGRL